MKASHVLAGVLVVALLVGSSGHAPEAAAKVRVVTSITDLRALVEAVGGHLVEVDNLARGNQNPHDIEVRPSLMLKVKRADLFVRNGAGGDPWAEPLVIGAQNPRILPGAVGYVDASRGVTITPPSGPVDRSRGDVHPEGNPHYTLDPATAPIVTANIVEGLKRVAPQHGAAFDARRVEFLARLEAAMRRWEAALAPVRGASVVTYHDNLDYTFRRFGLKTAGTIEDRPGIPPSPTHLAGLIRTVKEQKIKVVVADPFADLKVAELVARDGGARLLVLPTAVGAIKGVDDYLALFEHNVSALASALR